MNASRRTLAALAAAAAVALAGPGCRRAAEAPPPASPDAARAAAERHEQALAEGDRAYVDRDEPARLAEAVAAYGRAAAARPGDPVPEVRLARAEAFAGLAADDPARARQAWDASARAAERALRALSPAWAQAIDQGDDPAAAAARVEAPGAEALYWLALGAMRSAQTSGYAAVLAVKDATLAMMSRAAALDERVDAAGPHRALGAWRAALPVAAGGGAAAARAHFDRARTLFPAEPLARVAEAETYAVLVQDRALFERLLGEVLAPGDGGDPDRAPEREVARRRAKALLERAGRLF
ncbi:TRAP transporter TatT component family protein [Anaeromyxobacter sp. Red801]